jgi:glycosyltransferase involved in cell wall biosynthesis
VPAPKGAGVHIEAFVKTLADHLGSVELVTVSPTAEVGVHSSRWNNVNQTELPAVGRTLIHRVMHFRSHLQQWLGGRHFAAIHIRSIYEGLPIAQNKSRYCDYLIFEVNGLPSIELKYRYPDVEEDRELLQKLMHQENLCFAAADLMITPSHVTQHYLIKRGVPTAKIQVIPNGVDLNTFSYHPPSISSTHSPFRMLYFGTLSSWQGVDLAIRALAIAHAHTPIEFTIISSASKRQIQAAQALARKLGVGKQLILLEPATQQAIAHQLHQSDCLVAPLTFNDRNVVQGCCPLKVLEGMAAGTPVITSNLPVVQELGQHEVHFLALKPGSAQAIANAIGRLQQNPELRLRLSQTARHHIETHYSWTLAGKRLVNAYQALGINCSMTDFKRIASCSTE